MALLILQQTLTMLLLMLVGLALTRLGMLGEGVVRGLGAILIKVVIPAVVLNAFLSQDSLAGEGELGLSFALAALCLAVSCAISWLAWGRRHPVDDFSASYSNPSFFSVPIVTALFGGQAVFYLIGFILLLNLGQWTHGSWLLTGDTRKVSPKAVVTAPVMVAGLVGLACYLAQVRLPAVVTGAVGMLAQVNTPLAMLVLGSYLAGLTWRDLALDPSAYPPVAVRLVVAPLAAAALIAPLGLGATPLTMSVMLAAMAPVGSGVAIYAHQFGGDYARATKLVSLSTVLAVATMPLVYELVALLLGA